MEHEVKKTSNAKFVCEFLLDHTDTYVLFFWIPEILFRWYPKVPMIAYLFLEGVTIFSASNYESDGQVCVIHAYDGQFAYTRKGTISLIL